MYKGFFTIDRDIEDSWLWQDKPFTVGQAYIDLHLMAQYKDTVLYIKGQPVEVKRGQVFRTLSYLADRWGWSVGKVRRFLKNIENTKFGHANGMANGIAITLENYGTADDGRHANGMANGMDAVLARYTYNKRKERKERNKGGEVTIEPPAYPKFTHDPIEDITPEPIPAELKAKIKKGLIK